MISLIYFGKKLQYFAFEVEICKKKKKKKNDGSTHALNSFPIQFISDSFFYKFNIN